MDDLKDYEITATDLKAYKPKDVTRPQLIKILNQKIDKHWSMKKDVGPLEIDVRPEWEKILKEDGSILWDYQKVGWVVFHYQRKKMNRPARSWLKFSHPNFKGENK